MSRTTREDRGWVVSLFVAAFLLGIGYVIWLSLSTPSGPAEGTPGVSTSPTRKPTRTPRPTKTPKPTRTPKPSPSPTLEPSRLKVGIVAGHWQNDSGAACEDGLEEVDINLDVARQVTALLLDNGIQAELLSEFSPSLEGFAADAFVSIHSDSCEFPGLSGFKVARVASSAIPELEDRLVACLIEEYAAATRLEFHADTITFDMTDYHAFWEIAPSTPGAIIELGFMDADRALLTGDSDIVAQGVTRGILCFLSGR